MAQTSISSSPDKIAPLERVSNLWSPTPAVVIALLLAFVFLLRLPSALIPRELNVDESQMLSQAMKFLVDPRPWIGADTTSSGPLNSYFITAFLAMGFRPGFVLVHILASVLICFQILLGYLTLSRARDKRTATTGALMMVLLYGLATNTDYLHYASELLPTLFLMVGFYVYIALLDDPPPSRTNQNLELPFLGGFAIGTAPWCKLQAAPISLALGIIILAALLKKRQSLLRDSSRGAALSAFIAGAALPTLIFFAVLIDTGGTGEFWRSYIMGNLSAAGSADWLKSAVLLPLVFLIWPLNQLSLIALLGFALRRWVFRPSDAAPFTKREIQICAGATIYAFAAFVSVSRARHFFLHYTIFLVPPTTYMAIFLFPPKASQAKNWSTARTGRLCVVAVSLVVLCLYVAGAIRYSQTLPAIAKSSRSQRDIDLRMPEALLDRPESGYRLEHAASLYLGPNRWALSDSNLKIAAAVREIENGRPVHSIAIWGWTPGVYILTGIPPATRDSIGHFFISAGPMQAYFRARFLRDLRASQPDLFIDDVVQGAFIWPEWTGNESFESDPDLRSYIDRNYVLVDKLTLEQGAKPVRFFAKRGSPSPG